MANYLEISIDLDDGPIISFGIYTADNTYDIVENYQDFNYPYTDFGGSHDYCDIVLNSPVTITNVDFNMDLFIWNRRPSVRNHARKIFNKGTTSKSNFGFRNFT